AAVHRDLVGPIQNQPDRAASRSDLERSAAATRAVSAGKTEGIGDKRDQDRENGRRRCDESEGRQSADGSASRRPEAAADPDRLGAGGGREVLRSAPTEL